MIGPARGRTPPFGRDVIVARRSGHHVNLFVYCGPHCWDLARSRKHAVAVPTLGDSKRYSWLPIVGGLRGVTLIARGWSSADVDELARLLVRHGAQLVAALQIVCEGSVTRVVPSFYRIRRRTAA